MKNQILKIFLLSIFVLSACTANPPLSPAAANTPEAQDLSPTTNGNSINTPMGEFNIASSRFVEEVNGDKPGPGEKMLLITLTKPGGERFDPSDFSLEEFQTMVHDTTQGMIYILGDDESQTISTMAGWVGPEYQEFAMGFQTSSLRNYIPVILA